MIKNIILDVGKVLVEWDPRGALSSFGYDEKTIDAVAKATTDSPEWIEMDRSLMKFDDILAMFIAKAPEYEKEIRKFMSDLAAPIWQYDYAKDWIKEMKTVGYRVYILSNYSVWTYEATKNRALDFLPLVDGELFSYEFNLVKPDRDIYEKLLSKYNLKAEECLFFDDRQENIDGALATGMQGHVFTGIADARKFLESLN